MKTVVFDFGGVLLRWRPDAVLAACWPHRIPQEFSAQAAVQRFFEGYGGDWGGFDQGLIPAEEVIARIAARTGWPLADVAAVVAAVPAELQVQSATRDLLEDWGQRGVRCGFLSNMPLPYAQHLRATLPLPQWFPAGGVFSSEAKLSKPSRAIYDHAAAVMQTEPQELMLLDDHPANVEGALAAGWQARLFTTAEQARTQVEAWLAGV